MFYIFLGWFVFYFQELTYAKNFVFRGGIVSSFVPSVAEFIEARRKQPYSKFEVTVCEWHGGSIEKKRVFVADDEPERQFMLVSFEGWFGMLMMELSE